MDKINVVVCATDTEYKVAVKNKLSEEAFDVIGYADFEPSSRTRIKGFLPDVVLFVLDAEEIDERFFDFVELLELQEMGAAGIILTNKVTIDLVNEAAQAGIRQVSDISVGASEFCVNLENIVTKERRHTPTTADGNKKTRSRVYAFFSGKGGVGKTTLCTNAAIGLANRGKKVLLIDLDLQFGDADMALDLTPNETIVDLARDTNGVSIDNLSTCCITHASGLSLLSSPNSPQKAEYVTSETVKSILDVARNYYEYIIVDCGCALTDPVITAIEGSDTIFMVNDVNILSLKRAKLCLNVISQLNQKDKAKLVINKNVKKNTVTVSDYENLLGIPAYAVISEDFKSVNTSLNNGQPVTTFKPKAIISKDISSFIDKLVLEREGKLEKPAKGGFGSNKKKKK